MNIKTNLKAGSLAVNHKIAIAYILIEVVKMTALQCPNCTLGSIK